jgi:predicted enzyme related to lactoylglutathione lyase
MIPRPSFIELPSRDIDSARSFYAASFDWELTGYGPSYACTLTGDVDVGLQGDPEEVTQAPLPVIQVADLDATQARVEEAGGRIVRRAFAFPGGRRFHFRDPNGNELAVMQVDGLPDGSSSV